MNFFKHHPKPEPERHLPFFKLWDAFVPGECAICHLKAQHLAENIGTLFYENVNDYGIRQRLHKSLGFSPEIARDVQGGQDPMSISIIYRSLCQDLAERLKAPHPQLDQEGPCPVLDESRKAEARICDEFAAHYVAPDFQQRHEESFGLCVGHLRAVLALLDDPALRTKLVESEQKKFAALAAQLDVYLDKSRYDNRQEFGEEKDAWDRAVRKFHRPEGG